MSTISVCGVDVELKHLKWDGVTGQLCFLFAERLFERVIGGEAAAYDAGERAAIAAPAPVNALAQEAALEELSSALAEVVSALEWYEPKLAKQPAFAEVIAPAKRALEKRSVVLRARRDEEASAAAPKLPAKGEEEASDDAGRAGGAGEANGGGGAEVAPRGVAGGVGGAQLAAVEPAGFAPSAPSEPPAGGAKTALDMGFLKQQQTLRPVLEHLFARGYTTLESVRAACEKLRGEVPAFEVVRDLDSRLPRAFAMIAGE